MTGLFVLGVAFCVIMLAPFAEEVARTRKALDEKLGK